MKWRCPVSTANTTNAERK